MAYQPKNILVTGGAGFIGANFIHYALNNEPAIQIINLDKITYAGNLANLPNSQRHQFIQGDIGDRKLISFLLEKYNIDTIIHFAAESHVDRSIESPQAFIETNILGTFSLLEAARRRKCHFHHISTDEVYGSLKPNDLLFTETTAYHPNSPYAASKASSDHLVNAYHHTYGLSTTMTNCSNNYGPYQHNEKFIPTIIQSCINQKSIPIYGNGKNIRDWLYVEDHCQAILEVIKNGKRGETYNVGGNNEWENLELVEFICQKMDELRPRTQPYNKLITFVKDRPGHDFRYAIDTSKIARELKWYPKETLESGLTKTIKYYLTQHNRTATTRERVQEGNYL